MMENSQWLDKVMLFLAILIVGGGFWLLFQGVFALGKQEDKNQK